MSEYPQAFSTKTRTARKAHKCCECGDDINPGDKYQYSSGIWDGEAASYKQCLICWDIIQKVCEKIGNLDDAPGFGELREYFYSTQCQDYQGVELLFGEAKSFGIKPVDLNKLLKMDGAK